MAKHKKHTRNARSKRRQTVNNNTVSFGVGRDPKFLADIDNAIKNRIFNDPQWIKP